MTTPSPNNKVVLAYSGGLDTSVILKWLLEEGYEVICFIADLGQEEDFSAARDKALSIGASQVHIEDLKYSFITDYIFPAFSAGAIYERRYLLGTALARPLIAKRQIEIAHKENAAYVSHGSTGKGNDQVRFELSYYAMNPDIKILAPWKIPAFLDRFKGRTDMIHYAERHGIPVKASRAKPYSEDENILHISHEGGILEDLGTMADESVYSHTAPLTKTPDMPEYLTIHFKGGVPTALSSDTFPGEITGPLEIFTALNHLGSKHGIGRLDMVENRFVGVKSRGVYETPGGTILYHAHADLESITLDREVLHLKHMLADKLAVLIYNGFWFAPETDMIMAAINHTQKNVCGYVTLQLLKGHAYPVKRHSPLSLYDPDLSSFEGEGGYNHQDAAGFINLQATRLKAYHTIQQKTGRRQ